MHHPGHAFLIKTFHLYLMTTFSYVCDVTTLEVFFDVPGAFETS